MRTVDARRVEVMCR